MQLSLVALLAAATATFAAAVDIERSATLHLPLCNLAANTSINHYISARKRYFYNSTKDEEDNALTIAVSVADTKRGQALAVLLHEVFRYQQVRLVRPAACTHAFACAIRLSDLYSPSDHYVDLGFVCDRTQIYYYADRKHSTCALHWFGTKVARQKDSNLPVRNTCREGRRLFDFAANCSGGYMHFSKKGCQQKKLILASLAAYDAQLEAFLREFYVDDVDYVDNVCSWVKSRFSNSRPVWRIEEMSRKTLPLTVALLWPNGEKLNDSMILTKAFQGIKEVNSEEGCSKMPSDPRCGLRRTGFRLQLVRQGMDCNKADTLQFFSKVTCRSAPWRPLIGLVAGTCSETIRPVVELSTQMRSVVVSPTVDSVVFSNVQLYPFFFRTIPSLVAYPDVVKAYLRKKRWRQVGLLSNGKLFLRRDDFEKNNLHICHEEVIEEELLTLNAAVESLRRAKAKRCQIFAMDYFRKGTCLYMCAAHKLNMHQINNYLFILSNRAKNVFLNGTVNCANTSALNSENKRGCGVDGILNAGSGHIIIKNHISSFEEGGSRPTGNTNEILNDYFGVYTRKAIMLIANAIARLIRLHPSAVYHLNSKTASELYKSVLENTTFGPPEQTSNTTEKATRSEIKEPDFKMDKNHDILQGQMMVAVQQVKPTIPGKHMDFFHKGKNESSAREYKNVLLNMRHMTLTTSEAAVYRWRVYKEDGESRLDVEYMGGAADIKFATSDGKFIVPFPEEDDCSTKFMRFINSEMTCSQTIIVLIGFIFVVSVLIMVGFCCWLLRFCRQREEQRLTQPFQQLRDKLVDKEMAKSVVVINRKMGEGCFGTVFGGEVKLSSANGAWISCAVKIINEGTKQEAVIQFLEEAVALSRVEHDNIIKLLGVCTADSPFFMVMEMCLHGDLKSFLMARRTQALSGGSSTETCPARLSQFAVDIAQGVDYLHARQIVHRDLALRNCMVNERLQVKVGDFGLARNVKEYYRVQSQKFVPVRWMPPESIQYMYFTTHSDIWAYAVLLYELVTFGKFPFNNLSHQQVMEQVPRGLTLVSFFPTDATAPLRELVVQCWQFEPAHRPSICHVLQVLHQNPECVTACLDEAPPQQPPEELNRTLVEHQRSGRQPSGEKDSQPLSSSVRQLSSGCNTHSVNSTSSLGKLERSRIVAAVTGSSVSRAAMKADSHIRLSRSVSKPRTADPLSTDSAPADLTAISNGDFDSQDSTALVTANV